MNVPSEIDRKDILNVELCLSNTLFFKFGLHKSLKEDAYQRNSTLDKFTFSCYNGISTRFDIFSHLLNISVHSANKILENTSDLLMGYISFSQGDLIRLLTKPRNVFKSVLSDNSFSITQSYINDINLALVDSYGKSVITTYFSCLCQIDLSPN
jgi:hypothetical protein